MLLEDGGAGDLRAPGSAPAAARRPGRQRRVGWPRWPLATVWGMAAVWAGLFSYLSIRRHDAFWTGRFDLGNMVQAVWSTAQGRPLETTDVAGDQFVRLGAHVDPILVLFTPLAWTGVLPAGAARGPGGHRRRPGRCRPTGWGAAGSATSGWRSPAAAVYLLYPPLLWATLTEFHPVTLAAPLLLFCIWAAEERRYALLTIVRRPGGAHQGGGGPRAGGARPLDGRPRPGAALRGGAGGGRRWPGWRSPCWSSSRASTTAAGRRSSTATPRLGDDGAGVARTLLTRPWEAAELARVVRPPELPGGPARPARLPVAGGPAARGRGPARGAHQRPGGLVPAVLDRVPVRRRDRALPRRRGDPRPRPAAPRRAPGLAGAGARARRGGGRRVGRRSSCVSGVYLGPLPWWGAVPAVGSDERIEQYRVGAHADAAARAVGADPGRRPGVGRQPARRAPVRARAHPHLPGRSDEAQWVVVDRRRPYLGDRLAPFAHAAQVARLRRPAGHAPGARRRRRHGVPARARAPASARAG